MKLQLQSRHTLRAGLCGYFTQAIINNFLPLLFVTLQGQFGLSLDQLSLLVMVNFGTQLLVDLLATKCVDKIGVRTSIVAAHVFAAVGMLALRLLPRVITPYVGLIIAVMLYAVGGGLIEVLVSPIIESCETSNKAGMMSLLHSFYCWGTVGTIVLSTLFFRVFGIENWHIFACIWAIVPIANGIWFCFVPLYPFVSDSAGEWNLRTLLRQNVFWFFLLAMICAGAAEQAVMQWASAFVETGLGVPKTIGDLLGPTMFVALMGVSRLCYVPLSKKVSPQVAIAVSSCMCIVGYIFTVATSVAWVSLIGCGLCGLSVGVLWPGVFSVASARLPRGGTAMFALLALAGDLGCLGGPALVGYVSQSQGDVLRYGIAAAIVFPIVLAIGMGIRVWMSRSHKQDDSKPSDNDTESQKTLQG